MSSGHILVNISLALKPILTFICLVKTKCMCQAQLKQEKQRAL